MMYGHSLRSALEMSQLFPDLHDFCPRDAVSCLSDPFPHPPDIFLSFLRFAIQWASIGALSSSAICVISRVVTFLSSAVLRLCLDVYPRSQVHLEGKQTRISRLPVRVLPIRVVGQCIISPRYNRQVWWTWRLRCCVQSSRRNERVGERGRSM